MKTLKQIREEYQERYVSQVESLPEDIMLESAFKSRDVIPSAKEMPSLLVFRRVSFRSYPKGQVVALYYSKLVDKYLSIPFGPTGNLNLSEAVVLDEEQLNEWLPAALAAGGEMLAGVGASALSSVAKKGVSNLVKSGLKSLARGALKGITGKNKKSGDDSTGKSHSANNGDSQHLSDPHAKVYSSWQSKPDSDPIYQSRVKQASIAPIKENKISDIRKMVKEDIDSIDLPINGRSVTLNTSMAKRILEVYDSVNTKNKKIVEGMLNEDLESFKKLLNFSVRN